MSNMADIEQQSALHEGSNLSDPSEIITIAPSSVVDGSEMAGDILQQALDEVSEGFEEGSVAYTNATLADGSSCALAISRGDDNVATLVGDAVSCVDPDGTATYTYVMADQAEFAVESQNTSDTQTVTASVEGDVQFVPDNLQMVKVSSDDLQWTPAVAEEPQATVQPAELVASEEQPLGTSTNPIRIIQQGNQYTSLQQLTPEQLSQIMQVVQQQQLLKTTRESGGSSVLYNPQTQTRIVYKVIYPSDLHGKSDPKGGPTVSRAFTVNSNTGARQISVPTDSVTVLTGTGKRPYRKRKNMDGDGGDGPHLSREEREARKRRKLRTRSGRVSRPPKHMIKDYKHIHPVDLNEDPYDDSDGGYSDFKLSDGEKEDAANEEKADSYQSPYLIGTSKPKNFKCEKCDKAYIGKAGLARHFRIFPDHNNDPDSNIFKDGSLPDTGASNGFESEHSADSLINAHTLQAPDTEEPVETECPRTATKDNHTNSDDKNQDDTETETRPDEGPSFKGVLAPYLNSNDSSKADDGEKISNKSKEDVNVLNTQNAVKEETIKVKPAKKEPPHLRLKGNARARQAYMQELAPAKRKQRLRELMRQCTDEELMETVLPRLAGVITLWEFLLMKVEEEVESNRAPIEDIVNEFHALTKQVRKAVREQLEPMGNNHNLPTDRLSGENHKSTEQSIEISSEDLCSALGLEAGAFRVKPPAPIMATPLQYKFMTTKPSVSVTSTDESSSHRVVEVVSPEELIAPPAPSKHNLLQQKLQRINGNSIPDTSVTKSESLCDVQVNISETGSETSDSKLVNGNSFVRVEAQQDTGEEVKPSEMDTFTAGETDSQKHVAESVVNKSIHIQQPVLKLTSTASIIVSGSANALLCNSQASTTSEGSLLKDMSTEQQNQISSVADLETVKMSSMLMDSSDNVILVRSPFEEQKMEIRTPQHLGTTQQQMVSLLNGNIISQDATEFPRHMDYNSPSKMMAVSHDVSKVSFQTAQMVDGEGEHNEGGDQVVTNGDLVANGLTNQSVMEGTQVFIEDDQNGELNGELDQEAIGPDTEIFQTTDGLILIRSPDGTIQIHGQTENGIPMETVEALLAMGPTSITQMETLQTVNNA